MTWGTAEDNKQWHKKLWKGRDSIVKDGCISQVVKGWLCEKRLNSTGSWRGALSIPIIHINFPDWQGNRQMDRWSIPVSPSWCWCHQWLFYHHLSTLLLGPGSCHLPFLVEVHKVGAQPPLFPQGGMRGEENCLNPFGPCITDIILLTKPAGVTWGLINCCFQR